MLFTYLLQDKFLSSLGPITRDLTESQQEAAMKAESQQGDSLGQKCCKSFHDKEVQHQSNDNTKKLI